jgi:hypothetical protein
MNLLIAQNIFGLSFASSRSLGLVKQADSKRICEQIA